MHIVGRVTQTDDNLVNPPCQFQDPLFNKGKMVDVSFMDELVEVVRHARQGAEIGDILNRWGRCAWRLKL